MPDGGVMHRDGGSTPIPDPTLLTTQQLLRALSDQEKLFDTKLEGVQQILQIQLNAAKEAVAAENASKGEAIAKAERSTEKALDQMQTALRTATLGIDRQLGEISGRTIRLEEARIGQATAANTSQTGFQNIGMIVAALVSIASVAVAVIAITRAPAAPSIIVERPAVSALPTTTTTTQSQR